MQDATARSGLSEIGSILEPHRRALQLHCYHMTGSLRDAEDLVQETLLRAWRKYDSFKGSSSLGTWLYRIATNVCLDALKKRRQPRRLRPVGPAADPRAPVGGPTEEANWLEPYPDSELVDAGQDTEQRVLQREDISLAFLTVLQMLPPRQRAVFILSEVLEWRSSEVAGLLETSVSAVESALHRARATLARNRAPSGENVARADGDDATMYALLRRFVNAWEANDIDGLVALLHQDAILSMPPFSSWYQGRESVRGILSLHPFGWGRRAGWRLSRTRANGQPAFVLYRADQPGGAYNAFGLLVLSFAPAADSVSALTVFQDKALVTRFGLPLVETFPR